MAVKRSVPQPLQALNVEQAGTASHSHKVDPSVLMVIGFKSFSFKSIKTQYGGTYVSDEVVVCNEMSSAWLPATGQEGAHNNTASIRTESEEDFVHDVIMRTRGSSEDSKWA
ncbi:hypothetical protein FISHEDRAFT_59209 [Fistulina hepatica ATCC 64428]|uniref:Uncharacterized protein n=1 Tax=Fistulina hepatica ATCC 64428 TaxID=1128425 RepID=A0A0D7ACD7_9AGAR|nr:hypothetical protein FISHEDRAFT_59209 [Fistulina hepatica ATCC 64428]